MNQSEILTAPKANAIIPSGVVDSSFACGALFINMKEIKLSQHGKNKGKYVALVDDEDYDFLMQWGWQAGISRGKSYVRRIDRTGCKLKVVWMHREIMKTPDNMECDHIFHNGLDNRKYIEINGELKQNLRNCTHAQNGRNRRSWGKSKYLGVGYAGDQIQCHIKINGINTYIGSYKTEKEAAMAYDKAAKVHHREFANLNFK
jgi:hypothetical protein